MPDRYEEAPEIRRCMKNGVIPVANRWVESNVCHHASKKQGAERERIVDMILKLEYEALGLPKPHGIFVLHTPYMIAAQLREGRGGLSDGHENNPQYLRETEEVYSDLTKKFGWINVECSSDGVSMRKPEDIAQEILSHALNILRK